MKYPGAALITFLSVLYGSVTVGALIAANGTAKTFASITTFASTLMLSEMECELPKVKKDLAEQINQYVTKSWAFNFLESYQKALAGKETKVPSSGTDKRYPVIISVEFVGVRLETTYCRALVTLEGVLERDVINYKLYTENDGRMVVKLLEQGQR